MTLYEKIIEAYPDLTVGDFCQPFGVISLRNDSDGLGDYIEKWEYSKSIPNGLKLGK